MWIDWMVSCHHWNLFSSWSICFQKYERRTKNLGDRKELVYVCLQRTTINKKNELIKIKSNLYDNTKTYPCTTPVITTKFTKYNSPLRVLSSNRVGDKKQVRLPSKVMLYFNNGTCTGHTLRSTLPHANPFNAKPHLRFCEKYKTALVECTRQPLFKNQK